jgi:MYXO-CTERM domain-containing protein
MVRSLTVVAALAAFAGVAAAQVRINEIFINSPGTDDGFEFFELRGASALSLNGTFLLAIEGDGAAAGTVDAVIDLTGFSLGSNGLFLQRDSATVLNPAPAAGTTVRVGDFNPDLENGSNTYLLVSSFSGALGADLDTNNDGILDVTPWSSVLDGISLIENDGAANFGYAASLGFTNFGPNAGFNADALVLGVDNVWYGADVLGAGTGPFSFDTARMAPTVLEGTLTPGSENLIPTPGTLALAGIAGLVAARRRRA